MKIVLIGYMGSGKTTVARLLAKKLHWSLIEMDDLILKSSQRKSISEIFARDGEIKFREMEIRIAKKLRKKNQVIISTGGGVVMNKIILDYLKENAQVFFLKTSFDTVVKRLKNDSQRPLFKNIAAAKKLAAFREPLYEQYADEIIITDEKTPPAIINQIISHLK